MVPKCSQESQSCDDKITSFKNSCVPFKSDWDIAINHKTG